MVWEPKHGCCCCASPRTATLILGYLGVISAVFGLIGVIRMAAQPREVIIRNCLEYEKAFGMDDGSDSSCYDNSIAGISISVVEQLVQGGISVLLILGVNKRNHCLMIPYMIIQVLGIITCSLLFAALVILFLVYHHWVGAIIVLVLGGGLTFLLTYFFLVVRVCFKEVKAQQMAGDYGTAIEVGVIEHQQQPSPHPFKNILETQNAGPPAYSKLESQNSGPPTYNQIGFQPTYPQPSSM